MNLINCLLYSHLQEHLSLTTGCVSTHIYYIQQRPCDRALGTSLFLGSSLSWLGTSGLSGLDV